MGLDIYLYKTQNFDAIEELDEKVSAASKEIWNSYPEYNNMTDEQKKEAREKIKAAQLAAGMVPRQSLWPDWPEEDISIWSGDEPVNPHDIQIREIRKEKTPEHRAEKEGEERWVFKEPDSKIHPNHLFKIGYFRSSYNSSGYNNTSQNHGIATLYDIFPEANIDEYYVRPNWSSARERALEARDKWLELAESEAGKYSVMSTDSLSHKGPTTKKEAFNIFKKELESMNDWKPFPGEEDHRIGYSNANGRFYKPGVRVSGFMMGTSDFLRTPQPCCYVIVENDISPYTWEVQAMEIVAETCEYVIHNGSESGWEYFLHWSG